MSHGRLPYRDKVTLFVGITSSNLRILAPASFSQTSFTLRLPTSSNSTTDHDAFGHQLQNGSGHREPPASDHLQPHRAHSPLRLAGIPLSRPRKETLSARDGQTSTASDDPAALAPFLATNGTAPPDLAPRHAQDRHIHETKASRKRPSYRSRLPPSSLRSPASIFQANRLHLRHRPCGRRFHHAELPSTQRTLQAHGLGRQRHHHFEGAGGLYGLAALGLPPTLGQGGVQGRNTGSVQGV